MDTTTIFYVLSFILFIGVALRLPFLDYPVDEDFGFYTYPAMFRSKGVKIVDGYWGGFTPMISWIYIAMVKIFGKSPQGIRGGTALFNMANTIAVFYATQTLFGTEEALGAAFLFVLFTTSPYLGSFSCHSEGFYVLFLALGVMLFSQGITEDSNAYLMASAVLLGLSFLLKIVNIVFPVLFGAFLLQAGQIEDFALFSLFFMGTVSLFTLSLFWIYRGKNGLFWQQHKARLRTSLGFKKKNLQKNYKNDVIPIWRESSCILLTGLGFSLYLIVSARTPQENIMLTWLLATLLILVLQGVYLMYHFFPVMQATVILTAHALGTAMKAYAASPIFIVCILFGFFCFFCINLFRKWSFVRLYKRDRRLPFYQKADQFFYLPEIAQYIRENSAKDDTLYVWGPFVQLYSLAERKSCEGFLFHFVRPYGESHCHIFEEIMNGITRHRPKFIILVRPDFDLSVVQEISGCRYELERVFFNRYRIYRYVESVSSPLQLESLSFAQKKDLLERLTSGDMAYTIDCTLFQTGRIQEAFAEFEKALALHPQDFMVLFGKATLLRKTKKFEEAFEVYSIIKQKNRKQEGLHLERGVTFLEMGKLEKACQELSLENSLFPEKAVTFQALGITLQRQKKHEEALDMFRRALQKNPDLTLSKYNICSVYLSLQNIEQAKNGFKEILQDESTPSSFKGACGFQLGKIHFDHKEYGNAMQHFQNCLEFLPTHSKATEYIARLQAQSVHCA